jgi:hypothetical protein
LEAARLYDRKSIASNGLTAKTNFSYTKAEVEAILEEELSGLDVSTIDDPNLNDARIQKISVILPTL